MREPQTCYTGTWAPTRSSFVCPPRPAPPHPTTLPHSPSLPLLALLSTSIIYSQKHDNQGPYLLRLRKRLPGAPTTQQLHAHLHSRWGPLLDKEFFLTTEIIALGPDLIPDLNMMLEESAAQEATNWSGRPIKPPKKRRMLDDEEAWGLLVEDMSCGNYLYNDLSEPPLSRKAGGGRGGGAEDEEMEDADEDEGSDEWKDMAMIEFKPKWLTQSPNAPSNWVLCRTCAVRTMQSAKKQQQGFLAVPTAHNNNDDDDLEEESLDFCPLDLASGDPARIERAVFAIANMENAVMIADPTPPSDDDEEGPSNSPPTLNQKLAGSLANSLVTLLTNFFRSSRIIPLLTALQSRFGSRGVFTSNTLALMGETEVLPSEDEIRRACLATGERYEPAVADEDDIWTAMTLRDCSLFLKVWVRKRRGRGMEARVDAKVGDLDLKGGEGGRAVYWRDVERRLRMGGWYTGKGATRNCRTGEES